MIKEYFWSQNIQLFKENILPLIYLFTVNKNTTNPQFTFS